MTSRLRSPRPPADGRARCTLASATIRSSAARRRPAQASGAGLRRRAVPGCASLTPPGRFAPGNQHAGHELWVGGGAVPGVTGAVNLKKWHQHPPAGRTRYWTPSASSRTPAASGAAATAWTCPVFALPAGEPASTAACDHLNWPGLAAGTPARWHAGRRVACCWPPAGRASWLPAQSAAASPMASTAVTRSDSGPDRSCSATRTARSSTRSW